MVQDVNATCNEVARCKERNAKNANKQEKRRILRDFFFDSLENIFDFLHYRLGFLREYPRTCTVFAALDSRLALARSWLSLSAFLFCLFLFAILDILSDNDSHVNGASASRVIDNKMLVWCERPAD